MQINFVLIYNMFSLVSGHLLEMNLCMMRREDTTRVHGPVRRIIKRL